MSSSVAVLLCVWLSAAFCASSPAVDDCPVVSVSVCVCTVVAAVVSADTDCVALSLSIIAPALTVMIAAATHLEPDLYNL